MYIATGSAHSFTMFYCSYDMLVIIHIPLNMVDDVISYMIMILIYHDMILRPRL